MPRTNRTNHATRIAAAERALAEVARLKAEAEQVSADLADAQRDAIAALALLGEPSFTGSQGTMRVQTRTTVKLSPVAQAERKLHEQHCLADGRAERVTSDPFLVFKAS